MSHHSDSTVEQWQYHVDDSVLVAEYFSHDFDAEAVRSELASITARPDVHHYVAVERADDPMDGELFAGMEAAAAMLAANGIERVAVVSEGTKGIAARGKFDTAELTVEQFRDVATAKDWVRNTQ